MINAVACRNLLLAYYRIPIGTFHIAEKLLVKIFKPLFTTRPTGQGSGLDLGSAYDIVNAHGGEINVETKDGEGSEFFIQLPIS